MGVVLMQEDVSLHPDPDFKKVLKAAKLGNAEAQFRVAMYYGDGGCVYQSDWEASQWLRKSAEQGYAAAQCFLGGYYFEGWGVEKNPSEAVRWFRKAADQGFDLGQYHLANRYAEGIGVSEDRKKAVELYRKAAEQGYCPAQYALGICYLHDERGVQKDITEAKKWLEKAAMQGDATARDFVNFIDSLQ